MITRWQGVNNPFKTFRKSLELRIDRYPYPARNKLDSLKILIDDVTIRACHEKRDANLEATDKTSDSAEYSGTTKEATEHLEELAELNKGYNSNLHFTPLQSGITLSLFTLAAKYSNCHNGWKNDARRDLETSLQMHTMKEAFYESISGLYYLDDDFNDRDIHHGHALQMAGSEIASLLLKHLNAPTKKT